MRTFDTTSLYLGAAILVEVDGSRLKEIDAINLVNGRKIIRIEYPIKQDKTVERIIDSFNRKKLVLNLYQYNKQLIFLKSKLLDGKTLSKH